MFTSTDATECQNTCADPKNALTCVPSKPKAGCVCNKNYLKNYQDICVKKQDCTKCKDPNTMFTSTDATECQNTCADPQKALTCVPNKPKAGCVCKENYFKNYQDICVKQQDCTTCKDPNAMFTLTDATECQNTCANPQNALTCVPSKPKAGCVCNENYLKNYQGICVLEGDCTTCKDPNAMFTLTDATECQNTCADPKKALTCVPFKPKAGCVCNENYLKNYEGVCVMKKDCSKCKDPNAMFSYADATECQNTCADPKKALTCVPFKPKAGCICKYNYVKNDEDICVLLKSCPRSPIECTKSDEILVKCSPGKCQNTCKEPFRIASCTQASGCQPGCVCTQGYLRDDKGNCVKAEACVNCASLGYKNSVWSNSLATPCQDTCENPKLSQVCKPSSPEAGCICEKGYVRNSDGQCVKLDECPAVKCSGKHLVYTKCKAACQKTCDQPNGPSMCADICIPGCVCKGDLVRTASGSCIPSKECKADSMQCSGDNEIFKICSPGRCENTCMSPFYTSYCTQDTECRPGCVCNKGYLRNEYKKCVKAEVCVNCTLLGYENAKWSNTLATSCQDTCKNPTLSQTCSKETPQAGCICIDGYLKNADSQCVPSDECVLPDCNRDVNTKYYKCGWCPQTCDRIKDQPVCAESCKAGACGCKPGYLLNDKGKCVEPKQCLHPDCDHDANAKYYKCGWCPQTCKRINDQPVCDETCDGVECGCKPGFLLNDKGKCVAPKQCPAKQCDTGEKWGCPKPCGPIYCKDLDRKYKCAAPDEKRIDLCEPKCVCADGYLRNGKGKCVLECLCPPAKTG